MSPDGTKVFVTGAAAANPADTRMFTMTTLGLCTSDGSIQWVANDGSDGIAVGESVGLTNGGRTVIASGFDRRRETLPNCENIQCVHDSFLTVAYDLETGQRLWSTREEGLGDSLFTAS